MPKPDQPDNYRFGRFELQPAQRRLLASAQPAPLNPRAFDLLLALVERGGQLVTKDELLQRVWPKLVVEEANLQVQVSTLRKVLGAQAIETVAGHGYRLALDIRASAPSAVPAPRRHNLPRQLTPFLGRAEELAEQARLLDGTRLLTITGVGGLGKTRLSLQLASTMLDRHADGVWLVELAPLAEPRLLDPTVAFVLGVPEVPGGSIREALLNHVRDRNLLLIFDNCEHLLAATAELVQQLLQSAPHLKVITSSREPLRVAGEVTCALASLAVPDPSQRLSVEAVAGHAATRLFAERAAAALSGFEVTPQNAAAIVEICRRLDGIPLAIELAAARVRVISVEMIAQRLDDRFELLKDGNRTALPRQRTLRAVIDWSYDLLAPPERCLFGRLAVFAGGFTLDAAEAVGTGAPMAAGDVLDLLGNLVAKSLVVPEPDRERYRMLETVRQYALERLAASGDEPAARSAQLDFVLALVETAEPELIGPDQGAWYARLEREHENILAAHAWCARAPDGGRLGLRLIAAVRQFWSSRGLLHLGLQLAVEALARQDAQVRDFARCRALFTAGTLAYYMGRVDDALHYAAECLALARECSDMPKVSDALALLGILALARADLAAAGTYLEEALVVGRAIGDKARLAQALTCLGEVRAADNDLHAAQPLFEEGLVLLRELGERSATASTLINLARTAIVRASARQAAMQMLEAAAIIDEVGSQQMLQQWLAIASGLAANRGEWALAARALGAARALRIRGGYQLEPVDEAFVTPLATRSCAALGEAAFALAEAAGADASATDVLAQVRAWLVAVA